MRLANTEKRSWLQKLKPVPEKSQLYSKRVVFLRKALPMTGFVVALVLVFWPGVNYLFETLKTQDTPPISEKAILENKVLKATMVSVDQEGRPFKVAADEAVQVKKNQIELTTPKNELELKDGTVLAIQSQEGHFDQDQGVLTYQKNVTMTTTQGYRFETKQAKVHIKEGRAASEDPITGDGPMGHIESQQGFEIEKETRTLTFKGPTHLTLYHEKKE